MQRAILTPNIGNGSSACSTIVVDRLGQTPTRREARIAVLCFQLAFGHTDGHSFEAP